jgi:hypothetical protein
MAAGRLEYEREMIESYIPDYLALNRGVETRENYILRKASPSSLGSEVFHILICDKKLRFGTVAVRRSPQPMLPGLPVVAD